MVPRKNGLIVTVSSAGGMRYLFNVAYGVGKAAVSLFNYRKSSNRASFEYNPLLAPLESRGLC